MATIKTFEDLEVWKKARDFARKIYAVSSVGDFVKDFERGGRKEFVQFLAYAKGSAGESRSQLYRAFDLQYVEERKFAELQKEAIEISKMLSGLISYLNNSSIKGSKFLEPLEVYGKS
jgi:hypothetical protein